MYNYKFLKNKMEGSKSSSMSDNMQYEDDYQNNDIDEEDEEEVE